MLRTSSHSPLREACRKVKNALHVGDQPGHGGNRRERSRDKLAGFPDTLRAFVSVIPVI
jgi:hypothetical protein